MAKLTKAEKLVDELALLRFFERVSDLFRPHFVAKVAVEIRGYG
jgi:hypothetical protein